MILNPSDLVADSRSAPSQSGRLPASRALAGQAKSPTADQASPAVSDYLLVCEASSESLAQGSWQFTLEQADGTPVFSADDSDIGDLNRLTLLAAVRGLESIEGPSRVTLLSNNRYLIRSLSDSLPRWRQTNFVWEHFGRRIDVQHADLWRRIDHALSIHRVEAVLISSRLVSQGIGRSGHESAREAKQLRMDVGHSGPRAPRRKTDPNQQDRLRQWLIGSAADESGSALQRLMGSERSESELAMTS